MMKNLNSTTPTSIVEEKVIKAFSIICNAERYSYKEYLSSYNYIYYYLNSRYYNKNFILNLIKGGN